MSKFIFSILLLAALSGCATPARVDQMTAKRIDASKITNESPLRNNLSLKGVSGGESTNPLWLSKVGSDDFRQALEQSLKTVMLLSPDQSMGGYLLNATLVSLEQPWVGLDLQVVATVEYSLEERATGKKLLSRTIATPFTASFSDAVLAFERLKIANEGAVRENIEKIIDELLSLNISKQQISVQ